MDTLPMNPTPLPPLTEDELHALVDGRLDEMQRTTLEARLARGPKAQATVDQWRRQRALLQGLYADMREEPTPEHLTRASQRVGASQQTARQVWRWGALAASVLLSFAVGWFAHGLNASPDTVALQYGRLPATEFVRQASLAYAVYAPEVRHPVEVTTAEQAHLVQWLSKRLGRPLKIPDLSAQGFDLVGGRLLPGDAGARAQFMFQSPSGTRVTLYLGGVQGESGALNTRESSFQFAQDGANASFYWMDQGFGYALTGPVPRETLMQLARAVYQQL